MTQVVENLDAADLWYNRLFSPCRFYRALMPEAFRDASLLAISDLVIEPVEIAANLPGVERSPLARFKARYGNRLHSVAWYRSKEHTSELQSLMRISYAVFCLKTKNIENIYTHNQTSIYNY